MRLESQKTQPRRYLESNGRKVIANGAAKEGDEHKEEYRGYQ